MNKSRAVTIARWVLAVVIALGGVAQLVWVVQHADDGYVLVGKSLYGIGAILVGILLVGPELVGWAATPLHRMIDSVLMPSESGPPPANFHLARYYQQQKRFEEACDEYLKIIHYHPEETDAYLEGIASASLAGNADLAKKFYRKGQRILRSEDARQLLKSVYDHRNALEIVDADEDESVETIPQPGQSDHPELPNP